MCRPCEVMGALERASFRGHRKKRSPLLGFCKFQRHLRNTLCCPSDMMSFLPCTHASTSGHASDQAPFGQLQVRPLET